MEINMKDYNFDTFRSKDLWTWDEILDEISELEHKVEVLEERSKLLEETELRLRKSNTELKEDNETLEEENEKHLEYINELENDIENLKLQIPNEDRYEDEKLGLM